LRVIDSGDGIPEQHLGRIFDEEFHTRPQFAPEGIGYGLPMVRSIAAKFGWPTPSAEKREPHTGAVFTVTVPAARSNSR
jgi:signal transduction histidine kinase